MRVLVTRPEPDASETARRLSRLGHEAMLAPLLRIEFAEAPADLPEPAAIILTSRNGVRAIRQWPQLADWLKLPVFVTGEASVALAREAGFTDVRTAASDAAELTNLFRSEIERDAGPILYVAARDRAGALAGGLAANGYDIRTVIAYAAEMETSLPPAIHEALSSRAVDGIIFYSHRTAAAFRAIVAREGIGDLVAGLPLFALSRRVAEPLAGLSDRVRIAARPDEQRLFALLPPAVR